MCIRDRACCVRGVYSLHSAQSEVSSLCPVVTSLYSKCFRITSVFFWFAYNFVLHEAIKIFFSQNHNTNTREGIHSSILANNSTSVVILRHLFQFTVRTESEENICINLYCPLFACLFAYCCSLSNRTGF